MSHSSQPVSPNLRFCASARLMQCDVYLDRALDKATPASMLGLDESNPLPILTPMILQAGAQLWTQASPAFLLMQGLDVDTSSVIRSRHPVQILVHRQSWLYPMGNFGESFATGWNKLPDELKVRVLKNNLTNARPFQPGYNSDNRQLLHHLSCPPQIAIIAKEVFYTTNVFKLEADPDLNQAAFLAVLNTAISSNYPSSIQIPILPPRSVRHHIRHIQVNISPKDFLWDFLIALSRGEYGFTSLSSVMVVFEWPSLMEPTFHNWIEHARKVVELKIVFSCDGKIAFRGNPTRPTCSRLFITLTTELQGEVEDLIRKNIAFYST